MSSTTVDRVISDLSMQVFYLTTSEVYELFVDLNTLHFITFTKLLIYTLIQGTFAVVYMLVLTIVIAAITLVERKTLALVQRRVGPNQTAFRGRLQYIADAMKLLNKGILVLRDGSRWLFIL